MLDFHKDILYRLVRQFDAPIIQNNLRGAYVELMVSALLGDGWRHNGSDWAAYDVEHRGGTKLEVKQSSARQTWSKATGTKRNPSFSIRTPKIEWVGSIPTPLKTRPADIYVFAWHDDNTSAADHRDASQWQFFVLPTMLLPNQSTISLSPLRKLVPPVGAEHLKQSVEALLKQGSTP